MRLFEPARPLSDGLALYAPGGIAANARFGLPVVYVDTGSFEGQWRLTIHMPTSANSFAGFQSTVASTADLAAFFERWLADPEGEIERTFAYRWDAKATKLAGRAKATERAVSAGLAELGLDG